MPESRSFGRLAAVLDASKEVMSAVNAVHLVTVPSAMVVIMLASALRVTRLIMTHLVSLPLVMLALLPALLVPIIQMLPSLN